MSIFDKLFKAKAETKSFDSWEALVDLGALTASSVRVDPVALLRATLLAARTVMMMPTKDKKMAPD